MCTNAVQPCHDLSTSYSQISTDTCTNWKDVTDVQLISAMTCTVQALIPQQSIAHLDMFIQKFIMSEYI